MIISFPQDNSRGILILLYKFVKLFYLSKNINTFLYHNNYAVADIDLTDPEVEAAAAKIQSAFKMRGKKKSGGEKK